MVKEYKLTIQAAGDSVEEAIESAVRMLNLGANFDEVAHLSDLPESRRDTANPRL